jgi:predicted dehydrogenase
LNKINAYRLYQKIAAEKQLVFVYGQLRDTNKFAIAIGPQACPYAEFISFPKELTLIVDQERNIDYDYYKILAYLKIERDQTEHIFYYSRYSGKLLELSLEEILRESYKEPLEMQEKEFNLEKVNLPCPSNAKKGPKFKKSNKRYDLFIAGAGSYSFSYILPYVKDVNYNTLIDINPIVASVIGEKYGFFNKDTSAERALIKLSECDNPLLIIATYHSTHFSIIEQALSINPKTKVFVEKPPVTSEDQLTRLISLRANPAHFVEIGYNRRYSFFVKKAKELISQCHGPYMITCIVKEKELRTSHWYYWPSQGTRITGNLCHWIDLGVHFIQKKPVSIIAISGSEKNNTDEVSCGIKFEDGSLLTLVASERGNQLRGVQEYIDIRCGDITISIDDFLKMRVQKDGRHRIYRRILRDKGHAKMYKELIEKINQNRSPSYPNKDLEISTTLYLSLSRLLLSRGNFVSF